MDRAAAFSEYRNLLFSIAYRMLGSVVEAEDLVQEAYLRWDKAAAEDIASPKAYLTTIITRLCIDHLKSARVRRETYVGEWLPEPLVSPRAQSSHAAELADSISTAFLVMLESLTPPERAAFLLREVFDYDYEELAAVLDKTEANCRQLVKRARDRLAVKEPRFPVDPETHDRLVTAFAQAIVEGNLDALQATLAGDAVLYSDHGGKALAARRPIQGADKIGRFCMGLRNKGIYDSTTTAFEVINGRLGLVVRIEGAPHNAITFDVQDGRITRIYSVLNPDKLEALELGPQSVS